jgi:hypothetical protein
MISFTRGTPRWTVLLPAPALWNVFCVLEENKSKINGFAEGNECNSGWLVGAGSKMRKNSSYQRHLGGRFSDRLCRDRAAHHARGGGGPLNAVGDFEQSGAHGGGTHAP